jgi:pimeloyl-ACP methyl ester carboxylesterase
VLDAAVASLGIQYLVVDRPGFGGSDPHPGRTVTDFADDVEQLADALGLDRFAVVGVSAGAPYAPACAWAMRWRPWGFEPAEIPRSVVELHQPRSAVSLPPAA